MIRLLVPLALALALGLTAAVASAQENRFAAVFVDNTRVVGKAILSAGSAHGLLRLDNQEMFDPKRPVRWIRDLTLPAWVPGPQAQGFVEMISGDRLPGRLVGFVPGRKDAQVNEPPHLLVEIADPPLMPNHKATATRIRVLSGWVRRVVLGKPPAGPIEPGTLVCRNGRRLAFQTLRWQADGVRLLTDNGVQTITLAELCEIRMPPADPWRAYCEELAAMDPKCAERLIRVETSTGQIVTATQPRMNVMQMADGRLRHIVARPAWSLDPVHCPVSATRLWMTMLPNEIPLSRWPPVRSVQRPIFNRGRTWQIDRNVEGGPLATDKDVHGWGFGLHAPCELWFDMPGCVEGFRTRVAMDRLAGAGGCVRALICVNAPNASPLYQSNHLIGQAAPVEAVVQLSGPAGGQKHLILTADACEVDRPGGADPLDIRDAMDWIEPMFLLNLDRLKAEVQKHLPMAETKPKG